MKTSKRQFQDINLFENTSGKKFYYKYNVLSGKIYKMFYRQQIAYNTKHMQLDKITSFTTYGQRLPIPIATTALP